MLNEVRGRWLAGVALVALSTAGGCEYLGVEQGEVAPPESTITAAEAGSIGAFVDEVADSEIRELDLETALTLVAMPLSCLDRPHAAPRDRSTYLDEFVAARRPGYERNRAFYGCWDWHSAVNSTWAMVRIYKEFPHLPVAGLVQEKLNDHLSAQAMRGEEEFFRGNGTFERPYGWAWLMKLHGELSTWEHPDAARWTRNVEPLANLFTERMIAYLNRAERPSRSGAHSNTAFALAMMLDYARLMENTDLEDAIVGAAQRMYASDTACPTAYEPWAADFLSPCLEEAALMAAVLPAAEFLPWFDDFMPSVTSREFLPLTAPIDTSATDEADEEAVEETDPDAAVAEEEVAAAEAVEPQAEAGEEEQAAAAQAAAEEEERRAAATIRALGARSHLIGLSFIRADAMNRIADALPPGDPRIDAYRKLAELHGALGFEAMFDASYAGSHWIGTFALKYLLTHPQN